MILMENVYKVYSNGTKALNDVNLTINDGEFVFIEGSSGAGKSTLIKLLLCEESVTSGRIQINGYDLTKIKRRHIPHLRRTMGVVFQDFRLIPTMSVFDNTAFAMRVTGASGKAIRKRVPYILDLVGLSHKARNMPTELSGGEQQRVALARALVNNPSLLIADEPTGNVDPQMSYKIVDLFDKINQRGTTILMVTHQNDLVRQFRKRVITISGGTVAAGREEQPDTGDTPQL